MPCNISGFCVSIRFVHHASCSVYIYIFPPTFYTVLKLQLLPASLAAHSSNAFLGRSPTANEQAFFSSASNSGKNQNETATKSSQSECNDNDHVVPGTTSEQHGTSITIPGAEKGGRKLAIVFTCTVCDTRSAKQFSEQAYSYGVVIVRCPGCQNLHLIADRLGYFEDGDWDLDSIMAKTGQTIKTVTESDVLEVTLEDLVGKERMQELLKESESSTGKSK